MIRAKKAFKLKKSEVGKKFRVENNNLDISSLIEASNLRVAKIKDIGSAHREERDRKATAESTIKYIQISDIDVHLGRIKSYRRFLGKQAPNNARRIMQRGDVLVSTRRPTRGAVVAVPKEFDTEICTVFFTTLRIRDWDEVDPWFLALFLRTSLGRYQFQSLITETAYPVISDDDVENMTVLLPDIETQRELARKYDNSVSDFFQMLNNAYSQVAAAQQLIESAVLGNDAETVQSPVFGLAMEEEAEEEESSEPNGDNGDGAATSRNGKSGTNNERGGQQALPL